MKLKVLIVCGLMSIVGGCASFDDGLYDAGDVLSGDFRSLGSSKPATLAEICNDFISNQITGKKKWESQMLAINGIITDVSKTSGGKEKIGVSFRDVKKNNHFGVAYTRNALMVDESKVENFKNGDIIKVIAVLEADSLSRMGNRCSFRFEKARFQPVKQKAKK